MYRIIKDNSVHKNRSSTAWKIEITAGWKSSALLIFYGLSAHENWKNAGFEAIASKLGNPKFCEDRWPIKI